MIGIDFVGFLSLLIKPRNAVPKVRQKVEYAKTRKFSCRITWPEKLMGRNPP